MRVIYPVVFAAVLGATPVAAQQKAPLVPPAPPNKAFANVNFGFQAQSQDFRQRSEFQLYDETASFEAQHRFKGGSSFDIGGGVRVWRDLSVGLAFNRRSKHKRDVTVNAVVPSPVFSDTMRDASGSLTGLEHTESAVHLQALWHVPVTVELGVTVFAGPTFFNVEDEVIEGITLGEVGGNFSSVNLNAIGRSRQSHSTTGFHLGVDASYMLLRNRAPGFMRRMGLGSDVGVGALLRYSKGSVDLTLPEGSAAKIDTGGFEIAAGLRFRF